MPDPSTYNEKVLLQQIAEGDEAAFSDLYYQYLPRIYPAILRMVKIEAVVKDIIQEVFLNIWINRHKLPEVDIPANWIFRIVYNHSIKWLEHQAIRSRPTLQPTSRGEKNLTEEMVSFTLTLRLIKQAVYQLPPQARKVYTLSREEGLSIAAIAEALSLSPQTVKNSLTRSVKAIQTCLIEQGVFLPVLLVAICLY